MKYLGDLIIIAIPISYFGAAFFVVGVVLNFLEKFKPKLYEKLFKAVLGMTPNEHEDLNNDDFWEV